LAALEKIQFAPGGELLKSEGGTADSAGGATGQVSVSVEAHPVNLELLAAEGALQSETHQLLAALEEDAASVVTFRAAFENSDIALTEAELNQRIQRCKEQAKAIAGGNIPTTMAFGKGFVNGVWDGGVEMVGSAWGGVKLVAKGVAYAAEATAYATTSPMRVVWHRATTDMGYEQSCVSVWNDFPQPDPELQELAKGLKEMASLAADAAGGLVEAVLTMDEDKMAKLGGQFKDMFMLSIEVFQELWSEWNGPDEYQKGYLTGKATSEVAGMFMPWAKVAKTLGKLSKADFLVQLGTKSKFFGLGGKGSGALGRAKGGTANTFVNALQTTTACFPAGTPVLTAKGLRPIESIRTGDMVMGRDEATGAQDWRTVVDTITTHPDTLYHLRIRVETHGERFTHRARDGVAGGEGDADDADAGRPSSLGFAQAVLHVTGAGETITTTGNHPFYVLSRPQPGFIAADELEPGDRLSLADGGTAVVEAIRHESAAPGTRFRTYNLEVAEYHTYFVGQQVVWVHNSSHRGPCEVFKSIYLKMRSRAQPGETPYQTFLATLEKISAQKTGASDKIVSKSGISGKVTRLALKEMNDEMYGLVASGQWHWSKLPKMREMKKDFSGLGSVGKIQLDDMHQHHLLEGRYFERIKGSISAKPGVQAAAHADDVPAFIMKGMDHTPAPGTVAHSLNAIIGESTDRIVIFNAHKTVYAQHNMPDAFTVFESWWDDHGLPKPLP